MINLSYLFINLSINERNIVNKIYWWYVLIDFLLFIYIKINKNIKNNSLMINFCCLKRLYTSSMYKTMYKAIYIFYVQDICTSLQASPPSSSSPLGTFYPAVNALRSRWIWEITAAMSNVSLFTAFGGGAAGIPISGGLSIW